MTHKIHDSTTAMVKEAIKNGFTHIGGRSMLCKKCKTVSLRKFRKGNKIVYACNECNYRC